MENASKALVMAGGVLLAIMVLATLIYAANSWGLLSNAENESDASQQLAKFNREYESYNKDLLYGIDVISVLNKAIDNNNSISESERDELFVDIEICMITDVDKTTRIYKYYSSGSKIGKSVIDPKKIEYKGILKANGRYSLGGNNTNTLMTFLNKFMNPSEANTMIRKGRKSDEDGTYYEYEQTIVENSEFKTRLFACTEVRYNPNTGKINYMCFTEKNKEDYHQQ